MNTPQHHKADIGAIHGGMSGRRAGQRQGLIYYTKTADLKPHPLNTKLYGAEPVDAELLASIESNGMLEPLLVTCTTFDHGNTWGQYIVSGHSRWRVAMQLGIKKVPTLGYLDGNNPLEIEWAVIEANRQRVKTPEQKAREFTELKRIESALAKQREHTRKTTVANLPESEQESEPDSEQMGPHEDWMVWSMNRLWTPNDREEVSGYGLPLLRKHIEYFGGLLDSPREVLGLTEPKESRVPQGHSQAEALRSRKTLAVPTQWEKDGKICGVTNVLWQNGAVLNKLIRVAAGDVVNPKTPNPTAREKAARAVGLGARTAEKLEAVVEAADSGNAEAREALDAVNKKEKSVDAAYRVVNESSEERAAHKAEKHERNQRRFEHVNRIIEAGVAALRQAGEFTNDTQFALDWLRKANTPPTPPKVSVTVPGAGQQEVPEPTPKVVDASSQQESESKARRLEDYLTAIAETPHASPYQICRRLGAGEVPIFDKYNRELRKCAERAGLQWDKENKTWVKITMPFGLSCNPPKST